MTKVPAVSCVRPAPTDLSGSSWPHTQLRASLSVSRLSLGCMLGCAAPQRGACCCGTCVRLLGRRVPHPPPCLPGHAPLSVLCVLAVAALSPAREHARPKQKMQAPPPGRRSPPPHPHPSVTAYSSQHALHSPTSLHSMICTLPALSHGPSMPPTTKSERCRSHPIGRHIQSSHTILPRSQISLALSPLSRPHTHSTLSPRALALPSSLSPSLRVEIEASSHEIEASSHEIEASSHEIEASSHEIEVYLLR